VMGWKSDTGMPFGAVYSFVMSTATKVNGPKWDMWFSWGTSSMYAELVYSPFHCHVAPSQQDGYNGHFVRRLLIVCHTCLQR